MNTDNLVQAAVAAVPSVPCTFRDASVLTVCTPGYFRGFPDRLGIVLAPTVYPDSTWGEIRDQAIEELNAIAWADTPMNAEEVIRALFEGVDPDALNDFGLEPFNPDEDGDDYDVHVYIALSYDSATVAAIESRNDRVSRRIAALRAPGRAMARIVRARDHHAEHGFYPAPPDGPGPDQGFDDWAADVCQPFAHFDR